MRDQKIGIIGLGYVGLPLAHAFSEKYEVVGYDISKKRIEELKLHIDTTQELSSNQLKIIINNNTLFTNKIEDIKDCNIYIITVPTPVDNHKKPDISFLKNASKAVGSILTKNNIVIYESTVYPGCTEEECIPILERVSSLKCNKDFYCGYSPERINPGDKEHTVTKILKITSGSTPEIADVVDKLYASIITAGTYKTTSIKIAEAAKVIENSQRDINIAFVNELAIIFNKLGIEIHEVLKAAQTKWNFLPFSPGLVGGHCIGVDPYYIAHKAQEVGHYPEIILGGRRINDMMSVFIGNEIVKLMIKKGQKIQGAKVLIMGITFKENCPDTRNSKIFDLIAEIKSFGTDVSIYDPWVTDLEEKQLKGAKMITKENLDPSIFGAIVFAVAHQEFEHMTFEKQEHQIFYDVKNVGIKL